VDCCVRSETVNRSAIVVPRYEYIDTVPSWVSFSKGKAIPLQAWRGPAGSRRLRLPDFKTIGI
jgi:hypothetical protein